MTDPEDALRDLANASSGDQSPVFEPESTRPESPIETEAPASDDDSTDDPADDQAEDQPEDPHAVFVDDPAMDSASALGALSGTQSVAYDPGLASQSRRRHIAKPDVGMMHFRTAAVPVLITVALIMFALGVWGILVRQGNTSLPMADRPDASQFALIAMVGLPLGICLFAGAGFFLYQVSLDKKKIKAYEDAKKAARGR